MIDREIGPDEWIVADHRIGETPVLPGAAFLEMAAAAAGRSGVTGPMRISAVRWLRPFEVTEPRSLHLAVTEDNGRLVVELTGDEAGPYASWARLGLVRRRRDSRPGRHRRPVPAAAIRRGGLLGFQ